MNKQIIDNLIFLVCMTKERKLENCMNKALSEPLMYEHIPAISHAIDWICNDYEDTKQNIIAELKELRKQY